MCDFILSKDTFPMTEKGTGLLADQGQGANGNHHP